MLLPNYEVKKENVFVGQVIKTFQEKNKFVMDYGKLSIYHFIPYRSILFSLTENHLAADLLYDTKNYPALNLSSKEDCEEHDIIIRGGYNLEPLLTFFHFPDTLTLKDISLLRKHFFNGSWGYDHCQLFGFREILPEDWTYTENGIYVTNEEDLKRMRKKEQWLRKHGHRVFEEIGNGTLPPQMMYIFSEFGDHSVLEVLQGLERYRNAFKPHEEEGKIKKLII